MTYFIDFYIDIITCEIHQSDCVHISTENRFFLGTYKHFDEALGSARLKGFPEPYVCKVCNALS